MSVPRNGCKDPHMWSAPVCIYRTRDVISPQKPKHYLRYEEYVLENFFTVTVRINTRETLLGGQFYVFFIFFEALAYRWHRNDHAETYKNRQL